MNFREINTSILLRAVDSLGLEVTRTSNVTFRIDGHSFITGISCTAIDAFLTSIPLVWKYRETLLKTVRFFTLYFFVLIIINQFRLLLGFVFYSVGISWFWAHELPSAFFYFFIGLWIFRLNRFVLAPKALYQIS